ncbi:tetratricopeptide repeat protein [bacterium]|nr:tetratricopeptide repeat protein [bacterium]
MIYAVVLSALTALASIDSAQAAPPNGTVEAVDHWRAMLAKDSTSYDAWFGLARSLAFTGDHVGAVEVATELLAGFPDDPDALLLRGRVYGWLGQYERAEKDLLKVSELTPDYADAWSALADLYRWWQKGEKAVAAAKRNLQLSNGNPQAWMNLARAQIAARRFPEARETLNGARSKGADPDVVARTYAQISRVQLPSRYEATTLVDLEKRDGVNQLNQVITLLVKRQWKRGSLILGGQQYVHDPTDRSDLVGEGYLDLWPGYYGHSRLVYPVVGESPLDLDATVDLTRTLQGRYEVTAGWRRMLFGTATANIGFVGGGVYLNSFYFRAQFMSSSSETTSGTTLMGAVRWYFHTVDDYVDASLFRTRDSILYPGSSESLETSGWTTVVRGQLKVWRNHGLQFGLRYQSDSSLTRAGTAGYFFRF